MAFTNGERKSKKTIRAIAAIIPDHLALAPDLMLIIDCPTIASPPIPPKNPLNRFPIPCAKYSLFINHLVLVISSSTLTVSVASVNHTSHAIIEYGNIVRNVSKSRGIDGMWKLGKVPRIASPAKCWTVCNV